MRYLTKVVETYRLDSEEEVKPFLEELKSDRDFTIAKYSSQKKEVKRKGEIEDEWVRFEVTKIFNEEREPMDTVEIIYERGTQNEDI